MPYYQTFSKRCQKASSITFIIQWSICHGPLNYEKWNICHILNLLILRYRHFVWSNYDLSSQAFLPYNICNVQLGLGLTYSGCIIVNDCHCDTYVCDIITPLRGQQSTIYIYRIYRQRLYLPNQLLIKNLKKKTLILNFLPINTDAIAKYLAQRFFVLNFNILTVF